MNKTEDDELDAQELSEEELKQLAGECLVPYILDSLKKMFP